MYLKKFFRQFIVNSFYFLMSNFSPEMRRNIGLWMDKNKNFIIIRKLSTWYSELRPVDVYLLSFPKCGRTWLRLMIGYVLRFHFDLDHPEIKQMILQLEPLTTLNIAVPKFRISHDDNPHWKKSEELDKSKLQYSKAKVIFLVRDPRDVIVSAYFEQKKRVALWQDIPLNGANSSVLAERRKPYQGELSSFIYEDVGSLKTLISFYNIWSENRQIPKNFLLVRYEDLHDDTAGQLKRILNFLGIGSVEEKIISDAVQYTKFSNMHKMESNGSFNLKHLTPAEKGDPESYKTRKGIVGGFVEYFDEDEINFLNQQINLRLSPFYGYST